LIKYGSGLTVVNILKNNVTNLILLSIPNSQTSPILNLSKYRPTSSKTRARVRVRVTRMNYVRVRALGAGYDVTNEHKL